MRSGDIYNEDWIKGCIPALTNDYKMYEKVKKDWPFGLNQAHVISILRAC